MHKQRQPEKGQVANLRYAALRYHSGQYCPQYLLAGMVEYGINFATFKPLDAKALDFLHDSLKRMYRAEVYEREVSEREPSSSSSETSSDKAMIPCTFPHSVLQQMRPGGGEVQGSSSATENPANSLRSRLASFASGYSEDDEDDNSQQKCKRKKANFFIDKLGISGYVHALDLRLPDHCMF